MRMISNRWVDAMGSCAQYHNKNTPQEQTNAIGHINIQYAINVIDMTQSIV
jgi:hypothetical protein